VISLLSDESFSGVIIDELRRVHPALDLLTASEAGLLHRPDPEVLAFAAQHGRLVVASDEQTMIGHAYERVRAGLPMPGLIHASQDLL